MKNVVKTNKAPGAIGPYSQGINVGDLYFFSQALKNVKGLLESQGLDFSNVIKTTVFLDNMEDFNTVNEIYATYFVEPFPARSAVEVGKLPKGALIEVEVIACK